MAVIAKPITYFDQPGAQNTDEVARCVRERCQELGLRFVVVASNTGQTALAVWKEVESLGVRLIAVTEHAGFRGGDSVDLTPERRARLEQQGIQVFMGSHALSGVERSLTNKWGGVSRVEIIAHTLRRFGGDGLKVAVEVAIMAADAGLIPTTEEIIAVGGTGGGADTAVVLRAAHMNNFFDLEVREIIAKPRQRSRDA
jgi:hypothetical protein